jgi:hypothetical protein
VELYKIKKQRMGVTMMKDIAKTLKNLKDCVSVEKKQRKLLAEASSATQQEVSSSLQDEFERQREELIVMLQQLNFEMAVND